MGALSSPSWRRETAITCCKLGHGINYRSDVVLIAEFDGNSNPVDVPLVSFNIWVQIRDLPIMIKTEEMG